MHVPNCYRVVFLFFLIVISNQTFAEDDDGGEDNNDTEGAEDFTDYDGNDNDTDDNDTETSTESIYDEKGVRLTSPDGSTFRYKVTRLKFSDDYEDTHGHAVREQLEETDLYTKYEKWQYGWKKYPLYIIILGGFRWDYLDDKKKQLTSFAFLKQHGTSIPFVSPVFPPEDFPVWTSMATGTYPEDHSITGDIMFNLQTREFFDRDDLNSTRVANWWKFAEPFWSTAATHGRKLAFFNWHDCLLPGATVESPGHDCRPYVPPKTGAALPSRQKIARSFDEAFTKLYKEEYDLSVVYTDVIRRAAEKEGPKSPAVMRAIQDIDDVLQAKLIDIKSKEERAGIKMNVLVVSDYGITDTRGLTKVILDDCIDLDSVQYVIYSSGYASIVPFALQHEKIIRSCEQLHGADVYLANRAQNPPIYGAKRIPKKLHYSGEWTQDILIVAHPAHRLVAGNDDKKYVPISPMDEDILKADSGWNPFPKEPIYPKFDRRFPKTKEINDSIKVWQNFHQYKNDMKTLAFAMGPDFKKKYTLNEPVEILDFYQLICFLLQIPAKPNSGSWDHLEDMLTISSASHFKTIHPLIAIILTTVFAKIITV